MRIALATCADHPGFVADDDGALTAALRDIGIDAEPAIWSDPDINWSAFDACVIRTTWDYMDRLPEFLDWLHRVEQRIPTFNSAAIAQANLDKSYLRRLEAAGAPIIETAWAPRGEPLNLAALLASRGWNEFIIKPAIGAGASGLGRFTSAESTAAQRHLNTLLQTGDAMIQPFLQGVVDRGELSLVYIDGKYSHAVRKRPGEGDFRVQIEFGGQYVLEDPTPAHLEAARLALTGWPGDPLYARIDLVEPTPDAVAIIEVELVEPELFFPWAPDAGRLLGEAIRKRVESTASPAS